MVSLPSSERLLELTTKSFEQKAAKDAKYSRPQIHADARRYKEIYCAGEVLGAAGLPSACIRVYLRPFLCFFAPIWLRPAVALWPSVIDSSPCKVANYSIGSLTSCDAAKPVLLVLARPTYGYCRPEHVLRL